MSDNARALLLFGMTGDLLCQTLPSLLRLDVKGLLALVAMEPPPEFSADEVRDEKAKVLRSLRKLDASRESVIEQYTAGFVGGNTLLGYAEELGAASTTGTFVALKAHVDNWRRRGVSLDMCTGKRLLTRASAIVTRFTAAIALTGCSGISWHD